MQFLVKYGIIYLGDSMLKISNKIIKVKKVEYDYGTCNDEKILDVNIITEQSGKEIIYHLESCCYLNDLIKIKIDEELLVKRIGDFLYIEEGLCYLGKYDDFGDIYKDVLITFKRISTKDFEILVAIEKIAFYYQDTFKIHCDK